MIIIVKGSAKIAFAAAKKRGIESAQYYQNKPLDDDTRIVLQVTHSEREKVWAWFNEDLLGRAPFPQGALLYYSYEGEHK